MCVSALMRAVVESTFVKLREVYPHAAWLVRAEDLEPECTDVLCIPYFMSVRLLPLLPRCS